MRKEKALDLAAFFAEFEQMMIKKNRPLISDYCRKKMVKYCAVYLNVEGKEPIHELK
ncbi:MULTISPECIES: hypothetical protein [Bacillus subtilis group]|uniref:Uncharacterized protein n=1 Tax=Bacillus phage phi105 TaxID=10717 RepID=Q9ZXD0_BPPH1|nr:hypothetical protein [Bacillus subtilis]NP_690789.1 hypothetical protein phi105_36 [Bacillus phage phi105]YP_009829907.1 hypothetical protein HWA84_gp33 [Bacillus phage phi105]ADF59166.1 hypothetical protein PHI105_00165 [Bacillus phage phi105]MBF8236547.1 hypothetical protein [Bacillus subtilis]BAA36662.1 unnamed protein product [Bacillus phage phi105]